MRSTFMNHRFGGQSGASTPSTQLFPVAAAQRALDESSLARSAQIRPTRGRRNEKMKRQPGDGQIAVATGFERIPWLFTHWSSTPQREGAALGSVCAGGSNVTQSAVPRSRKRQGWMLQEDSGAEPVGRSSGFVAQKQKLPRETQLDVTPSPQATTRSNAINANASATNRGRFPRLGSATPFGEGSVAGAA